MDRLRGMPLDELRVRAVQALRVRMERVSDRLFPGPSGKVEPPDRQSTLNRGVEFLIAENHPASIARAVAGLDPGVRASFSRQSDDAEQGLVALLGAEPVCVGAAVRCRSAYGAK